MGRYRSLQSIMLAEALKGITDNQTIRYDMDYKKEIIGMIQKIESVRFLAMIYSFTHTLFEKEKNQWGD